MIKNFVKHGEDLALVLEPSVLESHQISSRTPLDISFHGDVMVVAPVRDPARVALFQEALERVNTEFGDALAQIKD